jgi:hypothetical protein
VNIRDFDDHIEIEGYVNAVERTSKPLWSRFGQFVERICKGAFANALKENDNVRLLLNHDAARDLGGTAEGTLELHEDAIGLHARAIVTDPETVRDGRNGDLVGWSFGFYDLPGGVENSIDGDTQLPLRKIRAMDLREVSILNRAKNPAYEGTLVCVRSDEQPLSLASAFDEEKRAEDEEAEEVVNPEKPEDIDYSEYEEMLAEIRRN